MGISIMANKIEEHNPINSYLFFITNTTYSAKVNKRLGDGDYSVFNSMLMEFFCVIK